MKDNFINKIKKYNINLNFYYIFFIILFILLFIFTFFDLQFSYLITDLENNQFFTQNRIAIFIEIYGEYILYTLFFLSVIYSIIYFLILRNKNKIFFKFFIFSLFIIFVAILSVCICKFLKIIVFERIRFRTMNYLNNFSYYSPWFFQNDDTLIKNLSEIVPFEDAFFSFPSGHTVATAITFCFFAVPSFFKINSKILKNLFFIVPIVLTCFTALERVVAGAHFATDVIGAMILCLTIVFFMNILFSKLIYNTRRQNAI